MIHVNENSTLSCDCGNVRNFTKYIHEKLVPDARGRLKNVKVEDIICGNKNCHESITHNEVNKQWEAFKKLDKKEVLKT